MSARVGTKGKSAMRNENIANTPLGDRRTAEDCSECGRRRSVIWPLLNGQRSTWICRGCGTSRSLNVSAA